MAYDPTTINSQQFRVSFRGYNISDVDQFLDQMAADAASLQRENQELKQRARLLESRLAAATDDQDYEQEYRSAADQENVAGLSLEERVAALESKLR